MRRLMWFTLALVMPAMPLNAECYFHSKLSSGEKIIKSVALLPPTIQVMVKGFRQSDLKEKEAEQLATALAGVVSSALKKRGWDVDDSTFAKQTLQDKEELRWLVGNVLSRHEMLAPHIKPRDVAKSRYSLGEHIAPLSAKVPADALVLVHFAVRRLTIGGAIGENVSFPVMVLPAIPLTAIFDRKDVHLRMSIVDSRNGDILCFLKLSSLEEEKILKELRKIPSP